MSAFTKDQYAFIVEQLAEGDDAHNIAAAFKVRFKGVNCTIDDVADAYRDLASSGWKAYHDAHRQNFEEGAPLARREFRIAFMDKMARLQAGRGASKEAAAAIEFIEKMDSGFYEKGATKELPPPPGGATDGTITWKVIDPEVTS